LPLCDGEKMFPMTENKIMAECLNVCLGV
jgi:hypothetical protein